MPAKRFGLTAAQKSDAWCRWTARQSLPEVGRPFGKEHSSIRCLVARHGGFVPAVRRPSLLALTQREREEISRGLASGSSIREIAKRLERIASTMSREVTRHGGRSVYRASEADERAWESALLPKRCLLAIRVKLQKLVASKLTLDWSPGTDFRLPENPVSRRREHARVPRNHLPEPVHSKRGEC